MFRRRTLFDGEQLLRFYDLPTRFVRDYDFLACIHLIPQAAFFWTTNYRYKALQPAEAKAKTITLG